MATKNQIMLDCLKQLSLVYGTSVNKYAEDKLYSMIDDALEVCFKERFWQRHIHKIKMDISNGYPTDSQFNKVCREFEDVMCVLDDDYYPHELAKANFTVIPVTYTGSTPTHYQRADERPEKIFRLVPPASDCKVWVIFRSLCKPLAYEKFVNGQTILGTDYPFVYYPDDEIPFDALAIKYKVCFNYMIIKGDNIEATQNFERMFRERMVKLADEETNNVLSYMSDSFQNYQHGWWSR